MSFKAWVQYLLERLVWWVETPRADRKKIKKENWSYRWFGILPISFRMFWDKQTKRVRQMSKNWSQKRNQSSR